MKHGIVTVIFVTLLAVLASVFGYTHSIWYIRGAKEDQYALWIAVLKGFNGDVYYVGNQGEFAYFRAGEAANRVAVSSSINRGTSAR
jgi:hypothetical protein